jgi:ABC-2 type transport system permease protein
MSNLPLILMTGLVMWQIIWRGAIDIPVNLLQEFWNRNLINLFSTPLKLSEWTCGVLLLCLFKLCITILFGALMVYLLYALNVFTIGWAFLPFAGSLIIFGWSVGLLAASAVIYWGQQLEALAWIIGAIFAPFSAVFYPVSVLPTWAQIISWCLPPTYIFEGMRQILSLGIFPLEYFLTSLVLDGLYLFCAFVLFQYMFRKSRVKGLARLE